MRDDYWRPSVQLAVGVLVALLSVVEIVRLERISSKVLFAGILVLGLMSAWRGWKRRVAAAETLAGGSVNA